MPKDDPDALNRAYNQSKQQMDSGRHPSNPGAFGNSTANPAGSSRHSSSGPKPCFPAGTFVQTPGGAEDIAHLEPVISSQQSIQTDMSAIGASCERFATLRLASGAFDSATGRRY